MSHSIQLSQDQHDIYLNIMTWARVDAEATLKVYSIADSVSEAHIIAISSFEKRSKQRYLITSLPSISNQVYLMLSDDKPEAICSLVAQFDADSESNDALSVGHISIIKDKHIQNQGWYGITILPISLVFEQFPDKATLNDDSFEFHLLVMLTKSEYQYALTHGSDKLSNVFFEQNRSLSLSTPITGAQTSLELAPQDGVVSKKSHLGEFKQNANRALTKTSAVQAFDASKIKANSQTKKSSASSALKSDAKSLGTNSTSIDAGYHAPAWKRFLRSIGRGLSTSVGREREDAELTGDPEKLEQIMELILGAIFVTGGIVLGIVMLNTRFSGALFFPIMFAVAGIVTLHSAFKASKGSR